MEYIWKNSTSNLVSEMLCGLKKIRERNENRYWQYVTYFSRFPLWGSFSPEEKDYTTFELRAKEVKQRSYEFIWLYKRLEDYTSKRTLYAILLNWIMMDSNETAVIRSPFDDYYEPDVFLHNSGDVFVDAGAFNGDSIYSYIRNYGAGYSKIYAYEISPKACAELEENTKEFHDIFVCQRGLGKEPGRMSLQENEAATANKAEALSDASEGSVDIVALDDELEKEGVTFIKMDIEGAEKDALLGCCRIITGSQPKLAICTYHGYEDIWRIPVMIDAMNPNYKFYMRHYGGNLFPTEFVLLCK